MTMTMNAIMGYFGDRAKSIVDIVLRRREEGDDDSTHATVDSLPLEGPLTARERSLAAIQALREEENKMNPVAILFWKTAIFLIGFPIVTYYIIKLTGALDQHPKEQVWNRIATERLQRGVWALSISGDGSTLAVSEALSGCVKIFTVHPWLLMCELCGDSPYFGSSTSLSHNGKHVAINEIVPRALGYVRVYTCLEDLCDSKSWALVGQEMLGRSPQDLFGKSLSLSADGNFLAVGAPGSTAAYHVDGKVYLYSYNGTHWDLETTFSSIETPEMFGAAVSLSRKGDIIAIGAPSLYPSTGTIAVYQRDTELETWQPLGVPIYGSHEGAALGQVVSLGVHHETNFTVASRSQSLSESQSSAQVFRYSDEHLHWISMRNNSVKDDGEEIAVDMASDGSLFAVGADRTFRLYEINASGDDWISTPGFLAGGKHIAIADQQPGGIIRLAAIGETEIDSFLVVYEGAEEGKSAQ